MKRAKILLSTGDAVTTAQEVDVDASGHLVEVEDLAGQKIAIAVAHIVSITTFEVPE